MFCLKEAFPRQRQMCDSGGRTEYSSGLAGQLAPTRIRAWSSRELQQGQGSSDGSVRSSSSSILWSTASNSLLMRRRLSAFVLP
jgi:hypothetical protein